MKNENNLNNENKMDKKTQDALHEARYEQAMDTIGERDGHSGTGASNEDVYEELAESIFGTESGKEALAKLKAEA